MMVTGAIVGAAAFALGWVCRMAWVALYSKEYEEEVEEGSER